MNPTLNSPSVQEYIKWLDIEIRWEEKVEPFGKALTKLKEAKQQFEQLLFSSPQPSGKVIEVTPTYEKRRFAMTERLPNPSLFYITSRGRLYWSGKHWYEDHRCVEAVTAPAWYEDSVAISPRLPLHQESEESKWLDLKLAPKDSRNFIGLTDGDEVLIAHYACDLSGEEQPPFKGFFKNAGSYNVAVTLKAWMPLPPPTLKSGGTGEQG